MYEEKIIKEPTAFEYGEKICRENGKTWLVKMPMKTPERFEMPDAMAEARKTKTFKFYSAVNKHRLKLADKIYKIADWIAYN